jgi:hypothetical protein
MQIILQYDSSVTPANFSGGAAEEQTFKTALNDVVGIYDSLFGNNVQITIDVGWGEINDDGTSTPIKAGDLSESHWYFNSFSYSGVVAALTSNGSTPLQAAAYATLPSTSPETDPKVMLTYAQQLALGLGDRTAKDGSVGSIGFDANTKLSFSTAAPSQSNEFYFIGLAEHEISEVMGRDSLLDLPTGKPADSSIMDLFRYSSPGTFQTSEDGNPSYFSINGGATDLSEWNNFTENNGDLGDWAASVKDDAFLDQSSSGVINALSPTDLILMDTLGWNISVTVDQWTGGSGLWTDTSDWQLGGPAGSADLAALDAAGSYTVASDKNVTVNSLTIATGAALAITGGTFTITDANPDSNASSNDGTLIIEPSFNNPTVALTIAGTIVNTGTIALDAPLSSIFSGADILPADSIGGRTETATLNISGDVTLEGVGTITLTNSLFNSIVGKAPGAMLDDINNSISGAGLIGNGDMALTVGAKATIDADDPLALTIDAVEVDNSGVMKATAGGGLVVHNDIDNTGKIEADGGNVTITGPLSGTGQIEIFSGNRVTLESSASNDVTFEPGGVASLILQHAQGFIGTVAGLAQSDGIDLVNFLFSGHPTISNVTGTGKAGTDTDVTIKDGTQSMLLKLVNATAGEFAVNAGAYSLSADANATQGTLFQLAARATG